MIDPVSDQQNTTWVRQGFSVRGAPKSGSAFGNKESRIVVDPQITFGFPDELVNNDKKSYFRFDVHFWEAERTGADKVRALFSDSTLSYMTYAWQAAQENEEDAKQKLVNWLQENWQDIAIGLVGAVSPAATGVISQFNLFPLVEALASVAMNQGATYHRMHRYIFELRGTGNSVSWRVISPSNTYAYVDGEGLLKVTEQVADETGKNKYDTEFRFRVLH